MPKQDNTLMIEDAKIVFRNFAGKEGTYNAAGTRTFAVLLDDGPAKVMADDGWNVKHLKPRPTEDDEEDSLPQAYIQVKVGYKGKPPKIVLITQKNRTNLGEDEIEMLDWADILLVDLIIRPYSWEVNGNTGVTAYLQSMFVTIDEDALELKYGVSAGDQTPGGDEDVPF